jgi:predicted DNA-binding ribbon-helix-helix protein
LAALFQAIRPDARIWLELRAPVADAAAMAEDGVLKRSVRIAGHATSVSLEREFWQALGLIARDRQVSIATLVAGIDAGRTGNLSSAIRVYVLARARSGELPLESS